MHKGHNLSKLFKLRKWLTVKETASHLTILLGEDIREADVFRLALDNKLMLSLFLPTTTKAKFAEEIPLPEELDYLRHNYGFGDTIMSVSLDQITVLEGICNFPMIGTERLLVEAEYYRLTTGNAFEINGGFEIYVEQGNKLYVLQQLLSDLEIIEDGEKDQMLRDHAIKNYFNAHHLPSDGILVVRLDALRKLENEIAHSSDSGINSKESTRKSENLLRALTSVAIDAYGYDPNSAKSCVPQDIVNAMSAHGINFDTKTVRNWLKEGADLLPSKTEKD